MLQNKSAVITGAGRGIGRSIALEFARNGADIVLVARSRSEIDNVADEIRGLGRKALAITCDVADLEAVERAISLVGEAFQSIDVLVNNAGGGQERRVVGEDDPVVWKNVIEVNLLGTYYFSRAMLPLLRAANGATIINVGSGMAYQSRRGNSSYNASKAAVWMFTRCLAQEVWEDKITVNELVPGPVHTDLTDGIFEANQPHPTFPSEWVKTADDVAPMALMMATQGPNGPTAQSFSLARRPMA